MRIQLALIALLLSGTSSAATFDMPLPEFDIIGAIHQTEAAYEDTLLDIARRYDIGIECSNNWNILSNILLTQQVI